MTNDQIVDAIIRREGGDQYTDRPSDRGGPTKFGITQRAWNHYLSTFIPVIGYPMHVRDLTLEKAREFYEREHVAPFAWIADDSLRELAIDSSVNHGRGRATKWLQQSAKVTLDGVIGPKTRAAVNTRPGAVYVALLRLRFAFYALIASDQLPADPDLPNLRGWINRACEFIR
jgi:lysozyme family protein